MPKPASRNTVKSKHILLRRHHARDLVCVKGQAGVEMYCSTFVGDTWGTSIARGPLATARSVSVVFFYATVIFRAGISLEAG